MYIKIKFIISLFLLILGVNTSIFSQVVTGLVTDSDTNSLPYATVFVKNTTFGTTTNFDGKYFFSLKPGNYTLVYSYMGHISQEKNITLKTGQKLVLDVDLKYSDIKIHGVEIVANKVDKAKKIMEKVRDRRRDYLMNVVDYECLSYVKTSIEKMKQNKDSNTVKIDKNEDFSSYMNRESMNLIEYVARIYNKRPSKRKMQVLAYHDFSMKKPPDISIIVEADYGEHDIASKAYVHQNPYLFDENNLEFDFYDNLLDFPGLCEQPLVSPISATSALNYKFVFVNSFYEDSTKINKIEVIPRNKVDALFYGFIYINDDKSALKAVNLSINEAALSIFQNFNIIQDYTQINDSIFLPNKTEVKYLIKEGKDKILGYSNIFRKDYKVNQNLSSKMFTSEVKTYNPDAYDKDSTFWANNRLAHLKEKELLFIEKTDSVQAYYLSNAYLDKRDSLFNKFHWYSPFFGFGHRNHYTGNEFYIGGLLEQINPFGIGGYRHSLPITYKKRFKNDMQIDTKFTIDYGFANKDVKGKVGVGFMYYPMRFMRTFVEVGNFYDIVNNYASFEQIFSRSNYVNTKSFMIQQRLEIVNGLYTEISLIYSNQIPINDLQLSNWSNIIFGELNEPLDFNQYIRTEAKIEFKYVIGQKYMIMRNRKIVIEDNYPEISLIYRKGIPDIFKSEVNFDYLELKAKADIKLARFGMSRTQITAGIFLNKTNLRLLEYKYFRGSDAFLFSNPIMSLQLLPATFSTNNEFLQLNYIHHFNGSLLNRVPLFKYLQLSIAAGTGSLYIPEQNFLQVEMFAGIEKAFRIKTDRFRIGLYAVTADNSMASATYTFKIGFTYYDSYNKKWGY